MTDAEYFADPGISNSDLVASLRSPMHFLAAKARPGETTPAKRFGSASHCHLLQPDDFYFRYAVAPRFDKRTKAGKESAAAFEAEHAGKIVIDEEDYERVMGITKAVLEHPVASELLKDGIAESPVFWTDPLTGERCKCKPDWMRNDLTIVDFKTTENASPHAFAKSCAQYHYHQQDAFYTWGTGAERFVFVVAERNYPHAVAVYELDANAKALGAAQFRKALTRLAFARATDEFPGYPTEIQSLALPAWAFNKEIEA